MKKENGITLVTLVVTIIILLILAGITIATLTGDDGLISKVKKAQEENNKAHVLETMTLVVTDLRVNAEANGENYDIEYIRANINSYLVDKKYTLSNVVIDAEAQTYQNILGTVDYSNKTYEFTIYWDTYKVAIGKFEGGKGNISVGSGNSYTVTINSSDTTNGIVSSGTSVVSGAILPIYAIPNAGYVFDGWEIIEGSGNATIANATSRNTQINNIVGNITVVGKFKASTTQLATAAQITQGYYAYDNEGKVVEGTGGKTWKRVSGKFGCSGEVYQKNAGGDELDMVVESTMTFSTKTDCSESYFNFNSFDTGLEYVEMLYITINGQFWITTADSSAARYWGWPTSGFSKKTGNNWLVESEHKSRYSTVSWASGSSNSRDGNIYISQSKSDNGTYVIKPYIRADYYNENGNNGSTAIYFKLYLFGNSTWTAIGY